MSIKSRIERIERVVAPVKDDKYAGYLEDASTEDLAITLALIEDLGLLHCFPDIVARLPAEERAKLEIREIEPDNRDLDWFEDINRRD